MGTLKKGTPTNMVDAVTQAKICVGDVCRDLDSGMECVADRYGRAIDKFGGDHSKGRLRVIETPQEEASEPAVEAAANEANGMSDFLSLSQASDIELKKELECRGWKVIATKEVMVPQIIEL